MATIRPNSNAPDGEAKYILPTATFDLAAGGSFETDDRVALADAEAHPWLEVDYNIDEQPQFFSGTNAVAYEDDYLSAPNSVAFDPEAIRQVEEEKRGVVSTPTAINAGLDQGVKNPRGSNRFVNETLAADAADNDKPRKGEDKEN